MKHGSDPRHPRLSVAFLLMISSREIRGALSTLYRTHRRYSALFVRRNSRDVFLFYVSQRRLSEARIGLVPIKTRKVLLQPWLLEHLAVPRVDFLPHLARIFKKQTFE